MKKQIAKVYVLPTILGVEITVALLFVIHLTYHYGWLKVLINGINIEYTD